MTSAAEREFHSECVAADIRADGRGREDMRPIELEAGVLPLASGSARVKLGRTDVIVGVKAEVSTPSDDKPDQGRVVCGVDCSPCAAVSFEGRAGDDQGKALAAALQRSFSVGPSGSGCGIDLKSLSIIPGRTCWVLYIDGLVLNHGGSLLDALSIAAKVALADMTIPSVEVLQDGADEVPEVEVDDDPAAGVRWDTGRIPVTLTVSLLNQHCIVDCTPSEEECVSAAVQVAVNAEGHVCGVSKTGTGSLGGGTLQEMLEIARNLAPTVIKSVDSFILSHTR